MTKSSNNKQYDLEDRTLMESTSGKVHLEGVPPLTPDFLEGFGSFGMNLTSDGLRSGAKQSSDDLTEWWY